MMPIERLTSALGLLISYTPPLRLIVTQREWSVLCLLRWCIRQWVTLAALDDALKRNDQKELARAIRNGRRAYKELVNRRKSHTLTPLAAAALEQLLSKITARIHAVRDRLMYRID